MRIPRIYFPNNYVVGEVLVLDKDITHYLIHVLRIKKNDIVELFNGNNIIYRAKIIGLNKHNIVKLIVLYKIYKSKESHMKLHLGQLLLNSKKMEFIIQKSVELGVSTITPIIPKNFNINKFNLLNTKIKRWQNIIINSCSQCGRNKIMKIKKPQSISNWCSLLKEKNTKIYFSPYSNNTINKLKKLSLNNEIYFLIGSESGLSKEDNLVVNNYKFFNISLGPRTLRVETAVISAITILQTIFGDMGGN
ncbi:MAG: 16S rRNA (uracil(1498)-N(3))-methyltransferase [Candidatus Lightella neohaematopini]|nr:16S rRNA (uracil(1498)-N(3))-methyltransferase [Candidatus Lightella neohaematopini]